MIIDFAAHHFSESLSRKCRYYGGNPDPTRNADPEVRLGLMEKYGIDVQALVPPSQTQPVRLGFSNADVAEICSLSNTDNYGLCKAYPERFVNICIISLLDMDLAMKELNRSINELDCRGVTIATSQKGKGLDSSEYFPFYEKLVEHDLPVFLHPTDWGSYPLVDMEHRWRMMHVFGWPFDTTQAVWRLIFGGIIDRYPSLKIVTHHLGGMLPYFSRRIEINFEMFLKEKLPRHISEYWANVYGDTALDGTAAAYPCGYAFFGADRMVFGTDYPMGPENGEFFIRENLVGVKGMDIPAEHLERILGGNAGKLLKIT
jgi:aminocarboxymuconate-semialdehyde decarboxylase